MEWIQFMNSTSSPWLLIQMEDLIFGLSIWSRQAMIPSQMPIPLHSFYLDIKATSNLPRPMSPWGSSSLQGPEPGSMLCTCRTRGTHSNSEFSWDTRIQYSSNSCILFLKTNAHVRQRWSLCKMNQQDILASNENLIYMSSEYLLVINFGPSLFFAGLSPGKGGSPGKGTSSTWPFCPCRPPWQLWLGLLPCRCLQGRRDGTGTLAGAPVSVSSSPHWGHLPSGCLGVSGQSGVFNCRLWICFLLGGILKL